MAAIHRAIGIASEGLLERLLGETDDAAEEAHSRRYEALRDQVTAFPRTAELVAAVADRGFKAVLATSGKKDDLEWMLPAIGAEDGFAGATTSSDVDAGKRSRPPAREAVALRRQRARESADETLHIGLARLAPHRGRDRLIEAARRGEQALRLGARREQAFGGGALGRGPVLGRGATGVEQALELRESHAALLRELGFE